VFPLLPECKKQEMARSDQPFQPLFWVVFAVFRAILSHKRRKSLSCRGRQKRDFSWCARLDSNQRPSGSEPNALSNWATDAHLWKPSEDGFQLFSYKWSNSSQTTIKPENAMPKNGFVMRFFGCARWSVGVVGAERSIQLSYGRTCMKNVAWTNFNY
jgi:hypothetical protein